MIFSIIEVVGVKVDKKWEAPSIPPRGKLVNHEFFTAENRVGEFAQRHLILIIASLSIAEGSGVRLFYF